MKRGPERYIMSHTGPAIPRERHSSSPRFRWEPDMVPTKSDPEGTPSSDVTGGMAKENEREVHVAPASVDSIQFPRWSATTNRLSDAGCAVPVSGVPSISMMASQLVPSLTVL